MTLHPDMARKLDKPTVRVTLEENLVLIDVPGCTRYNGKPAQVILLDCLVRRSWLEAIDDAIGHEAEIIEGIRALGAEPDLNLIAGLRYLQTLRLLCIAK